MFGKAAVKCAKCGLSSKEDCSITFHRFPLPSVHGSLKAKVWAKYCYPHDDWTSDQSLLNLYKQHRMICAKHFDNTSFTSSDRKRLNKFAIPTEARDILVQLRDELRNPAVVTIETEKHSEAVASTSQCAMSNKDLYKISQSPVSITPQRSEMTVLQSVELTSPQSPDLTTLQSPDLTIPHTPKLDKESRKSILKEIGLKKLADFTPKKQTLYKRCRRNLTEILRLRRKFRTVTKSNRDLLSSLHSNSAVHDIIGKKLSSSFYLLLQSQLQNNSRRLFGRRWTLNDKVLALSIYKKSSSCYRLLRRLFCLPSITSLKALLNKIPMRCGINSQIMETIKDVTKKRSIDANLCVVAFDEMSIRKNLSYNPKLDQIEGYQDHAGQGRTSDIACKALTFMAIGVRKNWKQPLAFYFSAAYVTADRLQVLIKEVLSACFHAGLHVIGIICDCDGTNLRAMNSLGSSNDRPFFDHEGHEIVTILDPPHLLKCFRNNFLKHDVQFTQDVQIDGQQSTGVAKWAHIEQLYNLEKMNPNFVFAPALTPQHLQPNGKQKMKVRLAAQVLSHSVAAGLYAKIAQNELPQNATATAIVVSNMDKLFDAMNGDTPDRKRGKPLLTNMSSTSPHLEFFQKMKFFFSEMKFLGARSKPPSQEGWLRTLNAQERILYNLKKHNIHSVSLRRLNQDPLENCFGCIRNNCGSNPNPTSVQFVAALKTSIVTNLINNNKNRNCLDDDNSILNNFKVFLCKGTSNEPSSTSKEQEEENSFTPDDVSTGDIEEFEDITQCSGEIQACAYVCGFIVKNISTNCETCKKVFLADQNTEVCHLFTSFKEYGDKGSLYYIQPSFCELVENAATLINGYLKDHSHMPNIKLNLVKKCDQLNYDWLKGCEDHQEINKKEIIKSTVAICLKRFCILKNREYVEEASKQSLAKKIQILKNA